MWFGEDPIYIGLKLPFVEIWAAMLFAITQILTFS